MWSPVFERVVVEGDDPHDRVGHRLCASWARQLATRKQFPIATTSLDALPSTHDGGICERLRGSREGCSVLEGDARASTTIDTRAWRGRCGRSPLSFEVRQQGHVESSIEHRRDGGWGGTGWWRWSLRVCWERS